MSSSVDAQQRSGIWSYFGFNSTPRRRTSVSLPVQNSVRDPFEKRDRHINNATPVASSRLMGNGNAAWMYQGQRARWLRIGGMLVVIGLVLYFATPSDRRSSLGEYIGSHTFNSGSTPSDPSISASKCSKPYTSSKPLIQYALMVDAGSTGSRIHVYRFNNCGPTPELEDEIFEQTPKREGGSGLSAYKDNAEEAAKSLDVLLDVAVKNVPKNLHRCTPIAVKATAGLRKVGKEKSDEILKAVRRRLETSYPFAVLSEEKGGVEVMDGMYEGVYAWITANYLLGKIGGPDQSPTAAVFDLGGGSTQIVFQPTFPNLPGGGMPQKMAEGDHKHHLSFGGREFDLYQHSYLNYGLMSARDKLYELILNKSLEENSGDRSWLSKPIMNPCYGTGMSKEVKVTLSESHPLGPSVTVKMIGPSVGAPAQCRALAEKTLLKDAECKVLPCAFSGVYQPSLEKTFAREDVYLFSYFYDRTKPLGMPESFTLQELRDLASRVCIGGKAWDVFEGIEGALEELHGRPESCLDLNFMLALLHTGYEMPIDREVRIAKKIKGNELGWCLGASLPLLSQESGWQCRIAEVSN